MKNRILVLIWITIGFAVALSAANKKFTLVIDAGHGGHDAGAKGTFSMEKNINLNVALAFGRYVESNCPDVKVIYTRKKDVFIPLHTRADIANKNKADLFVSIHTNAVPRGKTVRGMETYTLGMHRAATNLDAGRRQPWLRQLLWSIRIHIERQRLRPGDAAGTGLPAVHEPGCG